MILDAATTVSLYVSDATGQRSVKAPNVRKDQTVGELIKGLLAKMQLVSHDTEGHELRYRLRHERQARHLNGTERVGDALETDDRVTLQPTVDAGGA